MRAFNTRNGKVLSDNVEVADSVFGRMKGLIGKEGLDEGSSLWIKPCRGVHTIGMKFPIDVLFLDSGNRVVWMKQDMPPNRLSRIVFKARSVLELPAGTVSAAETRVGDKICF